MTRRVKFALVTARFFCTDRRSVERFIEENRGALSRLTQDEKRTLWAHLKQLMGNT
jgi:hypothetical protein